MVRKDDGQVDSRRIEFSGKSGHSLIYSGFSLSRILKRMDEEGIIPISLEKQVMLIADANITRGQIESRENDLGIINNIEHGREAIIYVPGENGVFLTKNSPIISSSDWWDEFIQKAYREDVDFYNSSEKVRRSFENAINDSIKIPYDGGDIGINEGDGLYSRINIPLSQFQKNRFGNFVFKNQANIFEDAMKKIGFNYLRLVFDGQDQVDEQESPYVKSCSQVRIFNSSFDESGKNELKISGSGCSEPYPSLRGFAKDLEKYNYARSQRNDPDEALELGEILTLLKPLRDKVLRSEKSRLN